MWVDLRSPRLRGDRHVGSRMDFYEKKSTYTTITSHNVRYQNSQYYSKLESGYQGKMLRISKEEFGEKILLLAPQRTLRDLLDDDERKLPWPSCLHPYDKVLQTKKKSPTICGSDGSTTLRNESDMMEDASEIDWDGETECGDVDSNVGDLGYEDAGEYKGEVDWYSEELETFAKRRLPPRIIQCCDKKLEHFKFERGVARKSEVGFSGFTKLLSSMHFADVKLEVGPTRKIIMGHRIVLAERSGFFESIFHALANTSQVNGVTTLDMPNSHYETLQIIIQYLYTGVVDHPAHPGYLTRLYLEAHIVGVWDIKEYIVEHLLENIDGAHISLSYILCLIRGFAECVGRDDGISWSDFQVILERIGERKDFRIWSRDSRNKKLQRVLRENGAARDILFKLDIPAPVREKPTKS
ncbi:hypothetical protein ABW19_dt0210005 [Dactylella cylindrospora]|nr:hypothetical protein ABW19_dt0210005 [Dactylella cylindrospora]